MGKQLIVVKVVEVAKAGASKLALLCAWTLKGLFSLYDMRIILII